MNASSSLRFVSLLILAGAAAACGSETSSASFSSADEEPSAGAAAPDEPAPGASAERAIAEADIIQLDEARGRLYAMSKSGSLAVVDVSMPGRLALLGKTRLPGEPFEMYRRGDVLLAMTNGAVASDGSTVPLCDDDERYAPRDLSAGAVVTALDVANPKAMRAIEAFKVTGQIADSRMVGDVLYLATYETGTCWSCNKGARTLVTSFDVSRPTAMEPVDQAVFASASTVDFNAAWAMPWKRSIVVTAERMYVGGLAANVSPSSTAEQGVIEVLDITDPGGKLGRGATIRTAGPMLSRWQVDELQGVLRVISQRGAGSSANGWAYPEIETFQIESTSSFTPLGHTTMRLPRPEGLKTVRFDGARAYAITFNQTDPLFTIDLSTPAQPKQRGELHMPGWMFHLEPRGDRLVGLGLDRTDSAGNLNVSLFDVSDMDSPRLLDRAPFGPTNMYEDYAITSGVLAEDQDRIQKAFAIFDDGLIAVPFSSGGGCGGGGGGVQLIDWQSDTLVTRAMLPVPGHPRRALRRSYELLAVSDSNVRSFSIARTDRVSVSADLVIGACASSSPSYSGGGQVGGRAPRGQDDYYLGDDTPRARCAVGAVGGGAGGATHWIAALVGLLALTRASRRRG